jgi:preprotein translocase subunit SecG
MLHGLLVFIHVMVSLALIVTVLLQAGKGGGLAGTFGGSGVTGGVFGGRGAAPLLVKATTVFAVLFMLTAISLDFVKMGPQSNSVLQRAMQGNKTTTSAPAVTKEMPAAPSSNTPSSTPAAPGGTAPGTAK